MLKKTKSNKEHDFSDNSTTINSHFFIFPRFTNIGITNKITILYGGIFSLSLFVISCFLTYNISTLHHQTVRLELMYTINTISDFLNKNDTITNEDLTSILYNSSSQVSVYSQSQDTFFESPPKSTPSTLLEEYKLKLVNGRASFSDGIKFQLEKKNFENSDYTIQIIRKNNSASSLEYVLTSIDCRQFMLISTGVSTPYGYYQIDSSQSMAIDKEIVHSIILNLIIINIAGIFCSFLIGRYISYKILQPVSKIRSTAERITIEDLSRRIELDGPDDEIKELVTTFNSMIDRLEKSFERQNQFVSDASHELRTPISVIQGYANLINRWGKSEPDVLQESLDSIITETDRMTELIKKLLLLAKTDQNTMPVQKSVISLNKITDDLVKEIELLEVDRQIIYTVNNQCNVWGDYNLIKQLLWIYAENAIKYTKDNDIIKITIEEVNNFACISVTDTGAGISEEDIPNIFNRFYRADKSRNNEISGNGLGLSIAKWILDTHFGTVEVKSSIGDGTSFINKFPIYTDKNKNK